MIVWDEPTYFYLFGLLVLAALVFFWHQWWQVKTQKAFSKWGDLDRLSPGRSGLKVRLKALVFALIISCLVIALVNPKAGIARKKVQREGIDLVFAIDVSKSMLCEDVAPNRLDRAKHLVEQITQQLAGDRIGIIAYAAWAVPQLPITTDYGAAQLFLSSINTDMISSQGTALGEAIELASGYFIAEDPTSKVLLLISDGEDHEGIDVAEAVAQAKEAGVRIFTVGVGTEKGGPIPIKERGITQQLKKDENGEVVITRRNETLLKALAEQAGGQYYAFDQTETVVNALMEDLGQLDKTTFAAEEFSDFEDQFGWFVGIGLILMMLDVLLLERKTPWWQKLKLFEPNKNA